MVTMVMVVIALIKIDVMVTVAIGPSYYDHDDIVIMPRLINNHMTVTTVNVPSHADIGDGAKGDDNVHLQG